jgi:hypothetical protein
MRSLSRAWLVFFFFLVGHLPFDPLLKRSSARCTYRSLPFFFFFFYRRLIGHRRTYRSTPSAKRRGHRSYCAPYRSSLPPLARKGHRPWCTPCRSTPTCSLEQQKGHQPAGAHTVPPIAGSMATFFTRGRSLGMGPLCRGALPKEKKGVSKNLPPLHPPFPLTNACI